MRRPRIALGMIVRDFVSDNTLTEFLDNASAYGHVIDRVVVVYSHEINNHAVRAVKARTDISVIKINEYEYAEERLRSLGMTENSCHELLHIPIRISHGLVPYGFNRNYVLVEALLRDIDILIFVDSDVRPVVLRRDEKVGFSFERIDFVGAHLKGMDAGADITSSDYSGYNILPPAVFPGMDKLLYGLHKENMCDFWKNSMDSGGIMFQEHNGPVLKPAFKVLGGNMGIRMAAFKKQPPFFSTFYFYNETPYLTRGEDTFLGLKAFKGHVKILDIDTHIFHDTYGDFPKRPDLLADVNVKNRLFYACTGWIGRNVFLRWLEGPAGTMFTERMRQLEDGSEALAEYTGDLRFTKLTEIEKAARGSLLNMALQYTRYTEAWDELKERWAAL